MALAGPGYTLTGAKATTGAEATGYTVTVWMPTGQTAVAGVAAAGDAAPPLSSP